MAVNKPVGDNARKGAVKKRLQVKTKFGGASAWTKRDRTSGEFMALKRRARKRPPKNSRASAPRRRRSARPVRVGKEGRMVDIPPLPGTGPSRTQSAAAEMSSAMRDATERLADAVEAGRRPGIPLDIVSRAGL